MADFDPDAYLSSAPAAAPAAAGAFDPDAYLAGHSSPAAGLPPLGSGNDLLTDMGNEVKNQFTSGVSAAAAAFNPLSDENQRIAHSDSWFPQLERGQLLARGAMGVPQAVYSPIMGPVDAVGGRVMQLIARGLRSAAVAAFGEDKVQQIEAKRGFAPGLTYEGAKNDFESLQAGLGPRGGLRPTPAALPAPPAQGPLGVTLSAGQQTRELPLIRDEQAAVRGQRGPAAAQRATDFAAQQGTQVAQAGEDIARGLDPFGQMLAPTAADAGDVVSQGVRGAATNARAGVDQLYEQARSLPGEISADTFTNMGRSIRNDLSNRAEPVIIDDQLTPYASRAIRDIDDRVAQLNIQNRASNTSTTVPAGQPATIAGVTLTGVDQMRKRLSAMRQAAFGSGNASDGRATRAVIDAFDGQIDHAINNGAFTGDPRTVQAWNDARAAHADYRSTFTAQKNDPVGRVVEKIIGRNNTPAAIPNDVADFLYGSSGTNPSTLNVAVANRMRTILGDQSPEWSAVRQGLFSRLTETPPGMTDYGPGQIAQRLNRFLSGDGRELAQAMFSPAERDLLQQYADLHRRLEVPRTGANWSETSTFLAPLLRRIGSKVGLVLGAIGGEAAGHSMGIPYVGAAIGSGVAGAANAAANAVEARRIARQMPLVAEQMQQYQRALARAQRANPSVSNATLAIGTTGLANALAPLGIGLGPIQAVQGSNNAQAQPQQHQRGGRVHHEPDRGEEGDAHYARGGRVASHNIDHAPTEAQKKAGNYAKDHVHIHGLDITIENARGAMRRGVGRDGKPWSVKMPAHYGYIKGTVGRDKDHVDVYVGPYPKSPHVFVVDQMDADSGRFDEHKALLGFSTVKQARRAYLAGFSDGKGARRLGHMEEMPVAVFKRWLETGDTTKRAQGVADDHKLPHKAVGYVTQSRLPDKHCSVCSMFREGHCSLVKDPINPGGWCRRFDSKE